MKRLYSFTVNKIVEKDVPTAEKDKDGKDITVVRKEKVNEPVQYFIKRPTRSEYEEAELFHDIRFGEDVRHGILTKSEIIKRFANEDVEIKRVYQEYTAKENELQRTMLLEKTDENNAKIKKTEQELLNILIDIQNFELTKSSVFEHTAENRARNKTIFWWILRLSHKIEEEKELPLFEGETFEDKQSHYERLLEQENEHVLDAIQRFFYLIPAWYTGNISKEEDFKKAEDLLKAEIAKNKEEQERLKKQEEADNKEITATGVPTES